MNLLRDTKHESSITRNNNTVDFILLDFSIRDKLFISVWKLYKINVGVYGQFPFVVTVYPKKYAHGFCFAVLWCGYTLTDFPISIRLTSLALWQSNDCPSASKATLMNMDKYIMWIHYERLHNHNKAKHNKTVCIFLGIYCTCIRLLEYSPYSGTPYTLVPSLRRLISIVFNSGVAFTTAP